MVIAGRAATGCVWHLAMNTLLLSVAFQTVMGQGRAKTIDAFDCNHHGAGQLVQNRKESVLG